MQRLLLATHRWLGFGLCLLMLAWFSSGMVMLFVAYPGVAPLVAAPLDAAAVAGLSLPSLPSGPAELTLRMHDGRPRWLLVDGDGHRALAGAPPPALGGELVTRPDQWTFSGALRPYFPLLRRTLADGTLEYRSVATGERVLGLARTERLWIALGPVVHWVYPTLLRRHPAAWENLVLALAAAGALLSASGLVYGAWRWRANDRRPLVRWHQRLGLVFGVLACSWTASGALSFNPAGWSSGDWASDDEAMRYYGGATLDLARFVRPPGEVAAACAARGPTTALSLIALAGTPWYRCHRGATSDALPWLWTRADAPGPLLERPPIAALVAAAQALRPGVPVAGIAEHPSPDPYYYATHRAPALELPYLVVRFADAQSTAVYIGLHSGDLLRRYERSGRWERWLYHAAHSWDFAPLYRHRWAWRATLLALLAGGAALAMSGVWMTARRLRRRRA